MNHKHIIGIPLLLLLTACGRHHAADALLSQADSLLAVHPDSAYTLLAAITPDVRSDWWKDDRMRYELTLAEAMNKAYVPFTTDSVMKRVARYYDRHGTSNEQLKAHYLLGCTYRDMGEAPIAILSWEDAIAAADTTSADCDYATLFRVYGQMADIYFRQYLPENELTAREYYAYYALKSGDTLSYIRGLLLRNDAYQALGDTAAIYRNTEHVRQLYLERGLLKEAAQVYPSAINLAVENGQYEIARQMMDVFEQESGLFDEQGYIAPTREYYYYDKGRYFAGIGLLDSAEIQFRRLLNHEPNLVDAYRGLVSLYLLKENRDSLRKYTTLYEEAIADYLEETQTQAIVQVEGMYDYSRQQRIAAAHKRKADILVLTGSVFVLFFITTIALIVRRYKRANEQERKRHIKIRAQYSEAIQKLAQVKREIGILQRNMSNNNNALDQLKQEKIELAQRYEEEIGILTSELASYKETQDEVERKAAIISHFHTIAKPHLENDENGRSRRVRAREASEDEWNQLIETVRLCYPRFYILLMEHSLSDLRLHVCILSRLGFENKDIVTLAKSSVQSVSNARIALAKVFDLTSTKGLDDYLKNF